MHWSCLRTMLAWETVLLLAVKRHASSEHRSLSRYGELVSVS
jgi:hypothetical protein